MHLDKKDHFSRVGKGIRSVDCSYLRVIFAARDDTEVLIIESHIG